MAEIIDPRVIELNTRIFVARLKLHHVLKRANLPRSTWHRWRSGSDPRRATLAKVDQAIIQMINEKDANHGS